MSLTLLEKDMNIISSLEDEPNDVGGMSAAELKVAFDEGNVAVKEFLNNTLIAELEALGVNKLVQYGSDTIKQIRVNEEGGLDVSPDGLVWATILGSSGGTTAIGALTFNGTTYYPTNYVVTLPGTAAIGALTFNGTTYYPTDYVVTLPSMFVGYGSCSTAIGTKAKTTTIENFALVTGAMVTVRFTNGNTNAAMTLNVNSTGAKNVIWQGSSSLGFSIRAGKTATMVYDGTYWNMLSCDDFMNPAMKMEAITYTGTGSMSKSVTFSITPTILMIGSSGYSGTAYPILLQEDTAISCITTMSNDYNWSASFTRSGKTVSWSSSSNWDDTADISAALNAADGKYIAFAWGY